MMPVEIFFEIPNSDEDYLQQALYRHWRVAVVGGPGCGKTTAVAKCVIHELSTRKILHTDDFKSLPWSDQPLKIIEWADKNHSFLIEGIQVARALRKGLQVDFVYAMFNPKMDLTPGQTSLLKGVRTIFDEWRSAFASNPKV
jgi:hypothetical protein